MERKVAALVLIAAGVWVQWGAGFGLMVAGVGLGASGLELDKVRVGSAAIVRRARGVLVAMPRRTVAAALVSIGVVALPVGAVLAAGAAAGWGVAGVSTLGVGFLLGQE